jgi:hypothetical protein
MLYSNESIVMYSMFTYCRQSIVFESNKVVYGISYYWTMLNLNSLQCTQFVKKRKCVTNVFILTSSNFNDLSRR